MLINNTEYFEIVSNIKTEIHKARYNAMLGANKELICLYWNIGKVINENAQWGNKFIDNLSNDIKLEFPKTTGYSVRNLKYMAKFHSEYTDFEFVQQVVAQIPWGHNIALIDKIKNKSIREWYLYKNIENKWSRNVLIHQIDLKLYERQELVQKVTNFDKKLEHPQSELAQQTIKDPYVFDFIESNQDILEKDLEKELVKNVTKLLLELGTGFAFLGNQYHIEVGGEDFYIDLLFYNINLRCYVVIELKTGKFKPEYAGQLNFYISAIDGELKKEHDNPTIGILLCKEKNNIIAEYALKTITNPMGISEYTFTNDVPKEYEDTIPSVEDIKNRINMITSSD